MPKVKSKSGARKRFKATGGGGFKRSHSHLRHILTKKAQKRKRQLRGTTNVSAADKKQVRSMLPYV